MGAPYPSVPPIKLVNATTPDSHRLFAAVNPPQDAGLNGRADGSLPQGASDDPHNTARPIMPAYRGAVETLTTPKKSPGANVMDSA